MLMGSEAGCGDGVRGSSTSSRRLSASVSENGYRWLISANCITPWGSGRLLLRSRRRSRCRGGLGGTYLRLFIGRLLERDGRSGAVEQSDVVSAMDEPGTEKTEAVGDRGDGTVR